MLKFEELFKKGIPKHLDEYIPDQYSIMREWQSFIEETKRFIEKTKTRKPIVDFKVRKEILEKFERNK